MSNVPEYKRKKSTCEAIIKARHLATYGFAIGSVDQPNNTITFYSVGAPSASKSLTINIKG